MNNWEQKLKTAYRSGKFRTVYKRYLKSKAWANKKEEFLSNPDNSYCQACYTFKRVQIHHKTYERVGDELMEDMVSLCGRCHRDCHRFGSIELTDLFVEQRRNGNF